MQSLFTTVCLCQVEDLQREALLKQYEVQNDSLLLNGLEETMQPSSCQKNSLFTTQVFSLFIFTTGNFFKTTFLALI